MNIGWRTKYILALSEDFLIHRWKLSGTMGLAHGFHFHKKTGQDFWVLTCSLSPDKAIIDKSKNSLGPDSDSGPRLFAVVLFLQRLFRPTHQPEPKM